MAAIAVEMAVSARYGYVRDELYFLAAGQHLAFGYVDQPPLTPLLARAAAAAGGNTLVALRVLPALGLAALVVATAAMSRMLGAGRTGQLLAALAAATCGEYLGAMHELTTTAPDFVCWAVTLLLVMKLLDSADPRWWLAVGASAGVASEAKWNIAFLVAALAAGFLATGARHLLASRYLLAGALIAAALAAPDLIWQAAHGWPSIDVFRTLQGQAGHNRAVYWIAQVLYHRPGARAGLGHRCGLVGAQRRRPRIPSCRHRLRARDRGTVRARRQGVLPGRGVHVPARGRVRAAGAVAGRAAAAGPPDPARRGDGRGDAGRRPDRRAGDPAGAAGRGAAHRPVQKINYDLGEEIAWPKLVALVAREYRALPPAQRRHTTILTANYGEAGAIARYGPGLGLPAVYSGANNFWLWGPPPAADSAAIVVNMDPAFLHREFRQVRLAATFWNGLGVSDDEQGAQVFVATGLRSSWAAAWPAFRDYS